jgi:hypothetical protein
MWLYERKLTCPRCQPNDKPTLQQLEETFTIQPILRYNLPEEDSVHTLSIVDQEQWQLSAWDNKQKGKEKEEKKETTLFIITPPPYQVWDTTSVNASLIA